MSSQKSNKKVIIVFFLLSYFYATFSVAENKYNWKAVIDTQLEIAKGSVLDFSVLVESGPAGKHGALVSGAKGHLVFSKMLDKPQRFMCASQPYGTEEGFPDHATADRYAKQLKMHGYNLARFHFIENVLMHGKNKDFDFDPVQLDRLYYFMAALKREGIYWMMDALTSWNGAYGDVGSDRWAETRNVKLALYYDENAKEHWKKLVNKLLMVNNPYTNLPPLKDPALMGVILVNEGGLNPLINQQSSEEMNSLFQSWLNQRYTTDSLKDKRWFFGKSTSELPRQEWMSSPRMQDTQQFYFELQSKTLTWMTDYFRELGYKGLLSSYNNWFHLQDIAIRSQLKWVDLHSYHDHPEGFVEKGAKIKQTSSLSDSLKYIREMASSRYWNKPLTVSEYDQPFWNKWRFESGLAMGAYASFQDWDLICRHGSGPIELAYGAKKGSRGKAIYPFGMALDPVARASETLASLLFLRKDVQSAKNRVALQMDMEYALVKQGGIGKLSDALSKISLVTGLGLIWADDQASVNSKQFNWVFSPDNPSPTLANKVQTTLGEWAGFDDKKWPQYLSVLQNKGLLTQDNRTDAVIFESDTGEILLNEDYRYLQVDTDRTEAVAFATNKAIPLKLAHLEIIAASEPALISLSAIDDKHINESKKMLLMIATDARNTGMSFQDKEEKVLEKLGHLPVLIKAGRFILHIKTAHLESLKLYALGLNGARKSELTMQRLNDKVVVAIVLDKLPMGVTTFFELAVD